MWLQCISRLDIVKVFVVFTEKEPVKEGLKDNLDVTLQDLQRTLENMSDAIG